MKSEQLFASMNLGKFDHCQDMNKCWLKCSQVALLILPLLLWAGNPETKTVSACAEQYGSRTSGPLVI